MLAVLGLFWPRPASGPGGIASLDPFHPQCTCPEVARPKSDMFFLRVFRLGSRGKRFFGPFSPPVHLSRGRGTQIGPYGGHLWGSGAGNLHFFGRLFLASGVGGIDSLDLFHPQCTCPEVGGPKSDPFMTYSGGRGPETSILWFFLPRE